MKKLVLITIIACLAIIAILNIASLLNESSKSVYKEPTSIVGVRG